MATRIEASTIEDRPMPPPAPRSHAADRRRENARIHGLYGVHAVAAGEDPDVFRAFRRAVVEAYRPRDDGEIWIVAEIAETMWRTRRLRRTETTAWSTAEPASPGSREIDSPALRGAMRVESHLDLRLARLLVNLERHRRLVGHWNGTPTPPTMDVDETAAEASRDAPSSEATVQEAKPGPTAGGPAASWPDGDDPVPTSTALVPSTPAEHRALAITPTPAGASDCPAVAETEFEPSGRDAAGLPAMGLSAPSAEPPPEAEDGAAPPAPPTTREDFVRLARARRAPVLRAVALLLKSDAKDAYDQALDIIGPDMRRWWEMRVTRTAGVRETWSDIGRRHPFWANNRTARALRDWLIEVEADDRRLLKASDAR